MRRGWHTVPMAVGLKKLYADGAYGGKCAMAIEQAYGLSADIVRHPGNRSTGTWQDAQQPLWSDVVPKGSVVQVKRWVVERTHARNQRAVTSCRTTTGQPGPHSLGSGWPKRASLPSDSLYSRSFRLGPLTCRDST